MEEPKEQVVTSTQVTQSTSTPGTATTFERIVMVLVIIYGLTVAAICVLALRTGNIESALKELAGLATATLTGAFALMQPKKQ